VGGRWETGSLFEAITFTPHIKGAMATWDKFHLCACLIKKWGSIYSMGFSFIARVSSSA